MNPKQQVTLVVNGQKVSRSVPPDLSLADFLHEDLGLSGTKVCCGMGICKACTVAVKKSSGKLLERAQACISPVTSLDGAEVTTVEGLSSKGQLSQLQKAFLKHFSFQCGYSAPGFLMGATILVDQLRAKPIAVADVDEAIEASLGEHVCRCTGYVKYHAAIKDVILSTPGLTRPA
jgi:aerobic-type carbon monoxide dehydrogenase small subunit (CoxS/CutS family)